MPTLEQLSREPPVKEPPAETAPQHASKPCPFCNGLVLQSVERRDRDATRYTFTIRCANCAAEGPPSFSPERAIRCWDIRGGAL